MMSIDHEVSLHSTQLRLKRYLFRPLFMNFPALDRLASIIPSRATARNLIRAFCTSLEVEMAKEHAVSSKTEPKPHSLCHRLIGAWHDGIFSTKEFHDNLKVLYVAGQENPQLLMLSSLYLLGKYPVRALHPVPLTRSYTRMFHSQLTPQTHICRQYRKSSDRRSKPHAQAMHLSLNGNASPT